MKAYTSEAMVQEVRAMAETLGQHHDGGLFGLETLSMVPATEEELEEAKRDFRLEAAVVLDGHFLIGTQAEEDFDVIFVVMVRKNVTDSWETAMVTNDSGQDKDCDPADLLAAFSLAVGQLVRFRLRRAEVVEVGPTHPLWTSFDDDDWNGATCGQWIRNVEGMNVKLHPPLDLDPDLLRRIRASIEGVARTVVVVG